MKENSLKIILIILLSFIAISLLSFMIFVILKGDKSFSFFNQKSAIILDETYSVDDLEKINIDTISSDIKIIESENNEIKILIYGTNKDKVSSKIEDQSLNILKRNKNNFCIGFCMNNSDEIILYLPKNIEKYLEIKSISGDIEIAKFANLDVNAKTTSGDIEIESINQLEANTKSGNVKVSSVVSPIIETISGDVSIENVAEKLNITTTSGNIQLTDFTITDDSNIQSTSGDIFIKRITDVYIEAKSTSGDIKINDSNRYSTNTLKIKTISGDITVK